MSYLRRICGYSLSLQSYGNDNLYKGKQSVESRVITMELDGKSRPPALHFQCYKVADLLYSLDSQ